MLIKLTNTLEGDLIIKITKERFQWEFQTGINRVNLLCILLHNCLSYFKVMGGNFAIS